MEFIGRSGVVGMLLFYGAAAVLSGCGKMETEGSAESPDNQSAGSRSSSFVLAKGGPVTISQNLQHSDIKPDPALLRASTSRWRSLIEHDYSKAYSFFSPATRETYSLDAFVLSQARGISDWQSVNLNAMYCEGDNLCKIDYVARYAYSGTIAEARGKVMEVNKTEQWLKSDGRWWYVPKSLR